MGRKYLILSEYTFRFVHFYNFEFEFDNIKNYRRTFSTVCQCRYTVIIIAVDRVFVKITVHLVPLMDDPDVATVASCEYIQDCKKRLEL